MMESANEQEVENINAKERAIVENLPNASSLENTRPDQSIKEDPQTKSTTDNSDECRTINNLYTETEKEEESHSQEYSRAFLEEKDHIIITNTEIDHPRDAFLKLQADETVSKCEDHSSQSLGRGIETGNSHKLKEPKDVPESSSYNITDNNITLDAGVDNSEPEKEKDFETAASLITQQNYENALRCQSQDLRNEDGINETLQYNDAEDSTQTVNSEDGSEVDKNVICLHKNTERPEINVLSDSQKEQVKEMKSDVENEMNNQGLHFVNQFNKGKNNEKEVFNISDDDSFHSTAENVSHTNLDSTQPLREISKGETQENPISNEVGEAISIDDESQTRHKCSADLKNSEFEKSEITYEVSALASYGLTVNNVIDDSSKGSYCEAASDSIKDVEEIRDIHFKSSTDDSVNVEEQNVNEDIENTRSSDKDTSIEEEKKTLNTDIKNKFKVNGDYESFPSPVSQSKTDGHLEGHGSLEDDINTQKFTEQQIIADVLSSETYNTTSVSPNAIEKSSLGNMEIDSEIKFDNTIPSQLNNTKSDLNKIDQEDESSHCSSLASADSNSTDTSSSHQLVIDHPMEEIDVGVLVPSQETNVSNISLIQPETKSEKVKGVKRKLSSSSELGMSPQRKKPYIEMETYDNENSEVVQRTTEILYSSNINTDVENRPFKSLLLQRLQTPYVPPPPREFEISSTVPSSLFPQPLEKTSFNVSQPLLPTAISNVSETLTSPTKYLCFKCKTGSFDSFTALNEHQRECLADTRLLPSRIMEIANILPLSVAPVLATPPPSASPDATVDMAITDGGSQTFVPTPVSSSPQPTATVQRKRYYKCSSCNTFHENWNLFLHIHEKHQRHMCIYCIRFFPTAEKLSVHLEIKHDLEQIHFNSEEALRKSVPIIGGTVSETRFLMCCTCQHLFVESEPFSDHICAEFIKPCTLCGQKGRHSNQCKAHPDAKRTSRTKKKSKRTMVEATATLTSRAKSHITLPLSLQNAENSNVTSFNCDSSQPMSLAPTNSTIAPVASLQNEDSNSSSNMVIDESCTTTHSSLVNPFKELDERWRMEQQLQNRKEATTLPEIDRSPKEAKLTVPKFKLRVPKEFQKSVDMALSSTDSEEDDDDEENEHQSHEAGFQEASSNLKNDSSLTDSASGLFHSNPDNNIDAAIENEHSLTQVSPKRIDGDNSQESRLVDKDELMNDTNPNLVRILQEIERTKLDIQRTKKTLHHAPRLKIDPTSEALSSSEQSARNWSPTPPTSPKQARSSIPQSDGGNENSAGAESVKVEAQHSQQLQIKYSQGSVAMDIDETITDSTSQQSQRETSEDKSQINTGYRSPELNTSSDNNTSLNISNSNTFNPASPTTDKKRVEVDSTQLNQDRALSYDDNMLVQIPETSAQQKETYLLDNKEGLPDIPADGVEVANEDVLIVDLQLDRPLEKIKIVDFVRICLKAVYPLCLYCNHARRIAVNGQSLVLHMLAQHRFSATVDSITAEELKPETIVTKLKTFLPILENEYFNSTSYCTMGEGIFTRHFNERIFECFQCRFVTSTHKELYLHNRKMHLKTAILCFMCRANFFSFSEILCHICPGAPNKTPIFDVKFRCCLCDVDKIPSPFRLMVHLRKRHYACDVCLEDCRDQGRLSSHVWKHKLHHLCYRCGIAYRNKMDITKHLFWKHGTESIICKRCLQKRWRHVYHFCVPPSTFNCDVCNLYFSKAKYLNVHKRLHNGDLRYPCSEENCDEKFISRKLLLKHTATHLQPETLAATLKQTENGDEESTFFKPNKESELESSKKESDLELEQDKIASSIDIKKEMSETVSETDKPVKSEKTDCSLKAKAECKSDSNIDVENPDHSKGGKTATNEEKCADTPRKKKKKNKRSKESLEDLNLIAPNLSETDSSEESDIENKSRGDENSLVPKIMLSPLSETENDLENVKKPEMNELEEERALEGKENIDSGTGKVLEIWKNFLQAQQCSASLDTNVEGKLNIEADYDDDNYPTPNALHVAYSDHDYCQMFRSPSPEPPPPPPPLLPPTTAAKEKIPLQSSSPSKRSKVSKSPRRASNRRLASSSSSNSSSSSDSSCSCGSNCSCSSSGSDSSSSSSSSDDSELSAVSNGSRKRHRKKSERERLRKKSESASPLKKHANSEMVNVTDNNLVNDDAAYSQTERLPSPPKEPQIYESDLETAESETDEEFYDEHPQKLASELLAEKRAQLMAQTRMSPSHNFDIVENSRPSTPSLPEDVVCETTRVKLKKKKRDRKSSGKTSMTINATLDITKDENNSLYEIPSSFPLGGMNHLNSYELDQSSSAIAETPMGQHPNVAMSYSSLTLPVVEQLTPRPIAPHLPGRMSEGSSCSDVDGSLKRSKRARRPNKFYGYTSDDENSSIHLGQPLMMGMRAIKPQPPPQLTWRKEDLPTPSKSIVNPKIKTTRTPKISSTPVSSLSGNLHFNSAASTSTKKKRLTGNTEKSANQKRVSKKSSSSNKLPPIPTLKIRPLQLGINNDSNGSGTTSERFPTPQIYSSSKETDDEDDDENNNSSEASSEGETGAALLQTNSGTTSTTSSLWNNNLHQATTTPAVQNTQVLQLTAPQPVLPTPQATVFNHKIPPALLPNPNFETLQYFKANNIRYPIRPPAGARQAREGESVYCYCRCPYDEVSEMIACDGENCLIEWFHFECVGIMVAPQGKWFCAECRPKYSEELYPTSGNV